MKFGIALGVDDKLRFRDDLLLLILRLRDKNIRLKALHLY